MSEKERVLWQAISRGLKLITSAIDRYVSGAEPAEVKRDNRRAHGQSHVGR